MERISRWTLVRLTLRKFCFLAFYVATSHASLQYSSERLIAAASLPRVYCSTSSRVRKDERRSNTNCFNLNRKTTFDDTFNPLYPHGYKNQARDVISVSTRSRKLRATQEKKTESLENLSMNDEEQPQPHSYKNLTPLGKIVAGSVEIAVVTAIDYIQGLCGGYVLGLLTDVPRLLFRPIQADISRPLWNEFQGRCLRMHQKSAKWGRNWAGISATYGGLCVATRILRGGKDDDWNVILSTIAAGAVFARKDGPKAMLRGAIVYGGLTYLISKSSSTTRTPFNYNDEPIEF